MACHMESGLEADLATNNRASGPHILGKEPECDSEGEQGLQGKGTEAGESSASSQSVRWSGVGQAFSREGDMVPHGGTQLQCPGKPVNWLRGATPNSQSTGTERGSGRE